MKTFGDFVNNARPFSTMFYQDLTILNGTSSITLIGGQVYVRKSIKTMYVDYVVFTGHIYAGAHPNRLLYTTNECYCRCQIGWSWLTGENKYTDPAADYIYSTQLVVSNGTVVAPVNKILSFTTFEWLKPVWDAGLSVGAGADWTAHFELHVNGWYSMETF